MENNGEVKGLPFKEFLDKITNLVTLFGVFNALTIYSATIENKDVAVFMLPVFFFLSIFVWLELILFTLNSNNGSQKYEVFFLLICMVELGLVYYFIIKFSMLLLLVAYFAILFVAAFGLYKLSLQIFIKKLVKVKESRRKNVFALMMLLCIIITGYTAKFTYRIVPESWKSGISEYLMKHNEIEKGK